MLRLSLAFFAVSALALEGCASPRTAIVVVVETDLAVPGELRSVRAVVGEGACADARCSHDFPTDTPDSVPFSFTIEPRGAVDASFTVSITGRDALGADLVSRRVDSAFVPRSTRMLVVRLDRSCRGVLCGSGMTCENGTCVSSVIDSVLLPPLVPGTELRDVPAPTDAPASDAADGGSLDADVGDSPSVDAPADAGDGPALPVSCDALPGGAPSGLTRIDPDGPGGEAPFDAYCENTRDGGGWTLLAKVDPGSTLLSYDATEWTTAPARPFGDADESVGDAILAPYWSVPVTALRVGSAGSFLIVPFEGGLRATLRDAMVARAPLDPAASSPSAWGAMIGMNIHPGTPPCVRSGLDVAIPDAGAPELRVRIGVIGSTAADCSFPTFWYGVAPRLTTSDANCVSRGDNAGGERVCGSVALRVSVPRFLLVYGR
jgi:hypothetical protein